MLFYFSGLASLILSMTWTFSFLSDSVQDRIFVVPLKVAFPLALPLVEVSFANVVSGENQSG